MAPAAAAVHLEETIRAPARGCAHISGRCPGLRVWAAWTGSRGAKPHWAPVACCWQPSAGVENMDGTRGHILSSQGEHVWGAHTLVPQLPGEGV